MRALAKDNLSLLIQLLREDGYEVLGPRMGEGAIVYGPLESAEEIPRGWIEEQAPGHYRLKRDPDNRFFAFTLGPQSWKKYLHPPSLCLYKTRKTDRGLEFESDSWNKKQAFLGVRACEMEAILKQDRVFLEQPHPDKPYQERRESVFLIGVNCSRAGGACFCVSTETGPTLKSGDDITLTELEEIFLMEARSERGRSVLDRLPAEEASPQELSEATRQEEQVRRQMGRELNTDGLPELLKSNLNHPRWKDVGDRCLTCGNCTMVCPTCFCFSVEEMTDLAGLESQRVRHWDSCFSEQFTLTSGHCQRSGAEARYRQWMTHKLATWHDQFDESGCVGCGRCIVWCPVGIDITEEAAAIREKDGASNANI